MGSVLRTSGIMKSNAGRRRHRATGRPKGSIRGEPKPLSAETLRRQVVATVLNLLGFKPTHAARMANRISDEAGIVWARSEPNLGLSFQYGRTRGAPLNIDRATQTFVSGSAANSKRGYSPQEAEWVLPSGHAVLLLLTVPHAAGVHAYVNLLRGLGKWPDSVLDNLTKTATFLNRHDPDYHRMASALSRLQKWDQQQLKSGGAF